MAAKRRKASGGSRKAARPARPSRKKAAPAAVVEEADDRPGIPVESAILVATAVLLLVAILLVDYVQGSQYGAGMFFSGSYGG